jgi:pimeloyl-ACP methyl ester carboxylesterase
MKMKKLFSTIILFLFAINVQSKIIINYGNNARAAKIIKLNGINFYYETYGSGQPLILIHGNSTGIKGWAEQIKYFEKHYKVYAIDCRGRGNTELGKEGLTYRMMAEDISLFIDALKLDSVNIVGKSDGGIIGIMLGIYYPSHINKIVAWGANMQPDTNALFAQAVADIKQQKEFADSVLEHNRTSYIKDTTKNWFLEKFKFKLMQYQPNITAHDLHTINVPVLVMSSDRDLIKLEHTLFIYNNISKANLCIFPGEFHRMPSLNPTLFNTTVHNFLSNEFVKVEERF